MEWCNLEEAPIWVSGRGELVAMRKLLESERVEFQVVEGEDSAEVLGDESGITLTKNITAYARQATAYIVDTTKGELFKRLKCRSCLHRCR